MERSADWLDEAEGDLDHARNDLRTGYFNWACFSAQQSAEKATKAALQKVGAESWGHSVADLLTQLGRVVPIPPLLLDLAHELDKADIPTRYPDALPSGSPRRRYTHTEAERLVDHAERLFQFCQSIVSPA
jgi:HEPN domain-containing protein